MLGLKPAVDREFLTSWGFKAFYVYSATSDTGEDYTLIADVVNKACMQIFLDAFLKTLSSAIILVMDNAPWHKRLKVPRNIEVVYLPSRA